MLGTHFSIIHLFFYFSADFMIFSKLVYVVKNGYGFFALLGKLAKYPSLFM
jgi:hypothetical protein